MTYEVVLRTHGGLGNQLFQIFFGRLFSDLIESPLKEVHDLRYSHAFSRSEELVSGKKPTSCQAFVSAARIPKLLYRIFGVIERPLCLGRTFYLDGYFQRLESYKLFAAKDLRRHLEKLANELSIGPADLDICLVHLRVGDFFTDISVVKRHVFERLKNTPMGSHIMTNDESILYEPNIATLIELRGLKLVTTAGMSAEEVLRTMARYRRIDANDSTLTFWASVFGGCEVSLKNRSLSDCCNFLKQYR